MKLYKDRIFKNRSQVSVCLLCWVHLSTCVKNPTAWITQLTWGSALFGWAVAMAHTHLSMHNIVQSCTVYVCVTVVHCVGERRRWVIAHIPPGHNSSPCCRGRGNPGLWVYCLRPDITGLHFPMFLPSAGTLQAEATGGGSWVWRKLLFSFLHCFPINQQEFKQLQSLSLLLC